jgi:hypothetical protein
MQAHSGRYRRLHAFFDKLGWWNEIVEGSRVRIRSS